jgi:hypothetical protein
MSTDKNAILIRALEASGSEREANLARAILGDPAVPASDPAPVTPAAPEAAPAAAPDIPAAPMVPAPVAAAAARQGPQPPVGKAPLQSVDEWEALPQSERVARLDEVDALILEGKN